MTAEVSPRWRRLEPDERRDQILACATRLFGERPYASVSTSELAAEAGVTRGLLHHYFGTKRELYLEVVRTMMFVPPLEEVHLPTGPIEERADRAIEWLLRVVETHGRSWVAVAGAEGVGNDPEVRAILDEADDLAADRVLTVLDVDATSTEREALLVAIRCFGGMVKATAREMVDRGSISRADAKTLLVNGLLAAVAPR